MAISQKTSYKNGEQTQNNHNGVHCRPELISARRSKRRRRTGATFPWFHASSQTSGPWISSMADVWVGSEIGFLKGKRIVIAIRRLCPLWEQRQVDFLHFFERMWCSFGLIHFNRNFVKFIALLFQSNFTYRLGNYLKQYGSIKIFNPFELGIIISANYGIIDFCWLFYVNSGIDLKKSSFTNHGVAAKVDASHEICAMCWADDSENQVWFQEFFW